MLGISIGVGAYICSVAVGTGAAVAVQTQLANLGENLIQIEAGSRSVSGVRTGPRGTTSLLPSDLDAIRQQVPLISGISANVDTRIQAVHGNQNWATQVRGISPDFLAVRKWTVARGSSFSDDDVVQVSKVALLGSTVAEQLFGEGDPLGQIIIIRSIPVKVVGVLQTKGSSAFGQDQDDIIMMPYTTVQKKIMGIFWLDDIFCSAVSEDAIQPAEDQIKALLRERHHITREQQDDFNIRQPTAVLQAREQSQQVMTILLASIASVALLVGGIGIMNIMLASVTERTREIGIRMAVGASGHEILFQFLVEAVTLSLVGGVIGIGLGLASSIGISVFTDMRTLIQPSSIPVAVGFAALVGIFFGTYPALLASRLDPVEALGR